MTSAVYTNGVEVTGSPRWVNKNESVDFVYTAEAGWLFDDGDAVKTNTIEAATNPTVDPAVFTLVHAAAKIGDRYYLTIEAAVAAAQPGDTVTLVQDVALTSNLTIGDFQIDCGGHSLTVPSGVALTFADGATLASTGIVVEGTVSFGATLVVTIPNAGQTTAVMTVPATMPDPSVKATVGSVTDYDLVNDGGALRIYKDAPLTIEVTSITDHAGTDFNGSKVTVAYSSFDKGCYMEVEALLTVAGAAPVAYAGELSATGGTMTFDVPSDVVLRGGISNAVVTIVGKRTPKDPSATCPAYGGVKALYQGKVTAVQTNGWFSTAASGTSVLAEGGAWQKLVDQTWTAQNPPAADDKILFAEDDEGNLSEYRFVPESRAGQVAVFETTFSFDGACDDCTEDVSGLQAAFRAVSADAGLLHFATLVGGAWVTNTVYSVLPGADYSVRITLDYRNIPTTVRYEVKDGEGAYVEIAHGVSGLRGTVLESVQVTGEGTVTRMVGDRHVDQLDDSLVADAAGNKYKTLDAAVGHDGLGLLWDTSWAPATMPGTFTLAANGYGLYLDPDYQGVKIVKNGDTYEIEGNYFEAMNLAFGAEGIVTNKFTYLTNVVAQAAYTNVWLLRDVTLAASAPVAKTMALYGDTNVLTGAGFAVADGKTLAIQSGFIGIEGITGAFALSGGRYTEASKTALADGLATDHRFAQLAVVEKTGYAWQVLAGTEPVAVDEVVLPVKDAQGNDAGSIALSQGWVTETVGTGTPAEQAAALSQPQQNGLTVLDNAVLGLKNEAGDIPVIMPVQSADATKVTFELGHVDIDTESGANVTYRVWTSSHPGGKDGGVSGAVGYDETVAMPLPDSGVQYYLIEVDVGATK